MTTTEATGIARPASASPLNRRATLWLLAAVLAVTVLVFGLAVLVITVVPGGREHALVILALTLPVHSLAVLLALHVGLRRFGTGWRALGFVRPGWRLAHLLWQIPALLVGVLLVQAIVSVVLQRSPTEAGGGLETVLDGAPPLLLILALVTVVVTVPIWEEAVFRGLIYGGLRRRWGAPLSILISATAFALAHGIPVLLPYLLAAGAGFALLYLFHRTLWAAVIAHGTINLIASTAIVSTLLG